MPPDRFISGVERQGLMDRFTLTLLDVAAGQMHDWATSGLDIPVSLNVSPSSLVDTSFPGRAIAILDRHGISPARLTLEVTETVAMTDVAHCLETLARLRIHGVGLSVDDFGTGHSSLHQLSRVPFTELKIDRAFVIGAATQPRLRAMVESSVAIARRLGITSVAEGVENLADLEVLLEAGCEVGQGFLFARPMDGLKFAEWVRLARDTGGLPVIRSS